MLVLSTGLFPRFAEPIPNVTVSIGRDALLACVVDNLRGYKVSALISGEIKYFCSGNPGIRVFLLGGRIGG